MLRTFSPKDALPVTVVAAADAVLPAGAVWIDLLSPTREEELLVEGATGIGVPTREEMAEIEHSSRFYEEHGAIYMTATLVSGVLSSDARSHSVSFVLTPAHLITVRYEPVPVFERFAAHVERSPVLCTSATMALMHLLEAVVDRLADGIEHIKAEMDIISRSTFRQARSTRQQRFTNQMLQRLIGRIGSAQDALSRARESSVSLTRALGYLAFALPKDAGVAAHIKSLTRDLASLGDHASYLSNNITFLLDAALGLISIEQNAVLKIFSVAAIVFMPPTLIAGIYGMNFKYMPELEWHIGYPYALVLMLGSAIFPYVFFRWRGWL